MPIKLKHKDKMVRKNYKQISVELSKKSKLFAASRIQLKFRNSDSS